MTTIQFIFIAIAAFVVLAGLFMVIRSSQQRQNAEVATVQYDKNGIPIIPRHQRNIIAQPDSEDTVSGETIIAPNRDYLHAVIEAESPTVSESQEVPLEGYKSSTTDESDDDAADDAHWQAEPSHPEDSESNHLATQMRHDDAMDDSEEPDPFSSLMSATDNMMPIVDTVEEPSFLDNSPILDKHLSEPVDQEQNAPLLNAQDNINITILPYQYRDRPPTLIRGRDLLKLVDKYGLRFGAMNMFHRYEQKDGTGMLWFSMMGMTDEGVAPFDPHNVATNTYTGLVVFLSLPHPQALLSFDSMMSVAYLMSNDLDAMILDENNEPISPEYKQQLRNQVRDYEC